MYFYQLYSITHIKFNREQIKLLAKVKSKQYACLLAQYSH